MSACGLQPKRFVLSLAENSNLYDFRPHVVTLYIVLSHMPHSCTAEVTAFLSTGGQTDGLQQPRRDAFDRAAASGAANKKLSNPRPPVREQWAKCRVSQSSFTQQLAENQQVGIDSAPTQTTRGEPRHNEVETENSSANDQKSSENQSMIV